MQRPGTRQPWKKNWNSTRAGVLVPDEPEPPAIDWALDFRSPGNPGDTVATDNSSYGVNFVKVGDVDIITPSPAAPSGTNVLHHPSGVAKYWAEPNGIGNLPLERPHLQCPGAFTFRTKMRWAPSFSLTTLLWGRMDVTNSDYGPNREWCLYTEAANSYVKLYNGRRGDFANVYQFNLPSGNYLTQDEWIDIEFSKDAVGALRLFIRGIQSATGPIDGTSILFGNTDKSIVIGGWNYGAETASNTYFDSFRLKDGEALHTADFDPNDPSL